MQSYGRFAAIYDRLMNDVDRKAWGDYVLKLLGEGRKTVVDCACGTGELTLRLAAEGYSLIGQDLSEEMLRVASEKARRARLNIPFIRQDMRKLSLHKRVDAIVSACDGVNYLASRQALSDFAASAYAALKPGGILLFDISSRYKLSTVLGNNTFALDEGDSAYIWQNVYDGESRLIRMDLTFFVQDEETGRYDRFPETHIQRAHSEREVRAALENAGFTNIEVYEAFTMDAPKDTTERLQFAALKGE
ncbi:MAG: class I SAM-dependent methyltransferase [Clostridiales bacterium]|nr:class I SAM-dependent methyltransferase [Clostridiales bacterium]